MRAVPRVVELLSRSRPIELIRTFDHGAGGTSLAQLGQELVVVKAWPTTPEREQSLTTGHRYAAVMAARSVPIPRLLERGTIGGYSYLFYEFAEGEWPPRVDDSLATQMLALNDLQRDAAPEPGPAWPEVLANLITQGDATLDVHPDRLRAHPFGRTVLREARSALDACHPGQLRSTDVVHGDFAPENLLVANGTISAVIDWEQSRAGDATLDLAGMIYDIELGNKADPNVLAELYGSISSRVPSEVWHLFTCIYAIRYAGWALGTDMETDVIGTIDRVTGTGR